MSTLPLFCVPDLAALRRRLDHAGDHLRRRLDHFLWVAGHWSEHEAYLLQQLHVVPEGLVRPLVRPDETAYCALAWLLTGDLQYARQLRGRLLTLADSVAERERGDWTQAHTWCDAFPFGRWLIYYDWVWESGVFSEADRAHLEERFMHYLWAHPHQRMKARAIELTPGNNQNASMALACAVGGYLFGCKRGRNALATELLDAAIPHLVEFVTAFPRGGYSHEGSTYMGAVNAFVLPIALDIAEAITGADLFDSRARADCASPREVFGSIMHLACPSGLALPWDNYGYEPASFTPAAAYLASRTGHGAALAFLDSIGANERPRHSGWGFDHHLWTLLYWPASITHRPADFSFNTASPTLGAGATGPARRLFFYQMWDRSHWPPMRAQFNPNNLVVDFDGSPLLLDGRSLELPKSEHFALPKYAFRRPDMNSIASFGSGTVGAHNCIFFDGKEEWAPRQSFEGRLVAADYQAGAALVEGEVTAGYAGDVDVTEVRRATLLVGDDFILVRDRIAAQSSHKISWRAHLRAGALTIDGSHLQLLATDRTRLEICSPDARVWLHRRFQDPEMLTRTNGQLEGAMHEITADVEGQEIDLVTLLVPAPGLAPWRGLGDTWQWQWAADEQAAERLLADWPGGCPIDPAAGSWFYQTGEHRPGVGVYRTAFELDGDVPKGVCLRVPHHSRSAILQVNGEVYPLELGYEMDQLMPRLIEIGSSLRSGRNLISLLIPSTLEHALHGRLELLAPVPAPPPASIVAAGTDRWGVEAHGRNWEIAWGTEAVLIKAEDGTVITLDPKALPAPSASPVAAAPEPATVVREARERLIPLPRSSRRDTATLIAELQSAEWTRVLRALEEARQQPDDALVAAVWQLFQHEVATHTTDAGRDPADTAWYRIKAEAACVLGVARHEAAVDLLGQLAISRAFYPARVAAAKALGQIDTPTARAWLARISPFEEVNLVATARRGGEV